MMKSDRGLRIGIVGVGQGGGKIAEEFCRRGYPTMAVNTADVDLGALSNIPEALRVRIGFTQGAGKDPRLGEEAIRRSADKVLRTMRQAFASVDYIFVAGCLGGGTGTGAMADLVEISRSFDVPVGCLATLPMIDESLEEQRNALLGLDILQGVNPKPFMLPDNEYLRAKLPAGQAKTGVAFWGAINRAIVDQLDRINVLSARTSNLHAFDRQDLVRLLQTEGILTVEAIQGKADKQAEAMAVSVEQELASFFEAVHLEPLALRAAVLMESWDKQSLRPAVFEPIVFTIQRVTEAPTVFKGMYHLESAADLAVTIAIAGLKLPAERLLAAKERIKTGVESVRKREGFKIEGLIDGLEGWDEIRSEDSQVQPRMLRAVKNTDFEDVLANIRDGKRRFGN